MRSSRQQPSQVAGSAPVERLPRLTLGSTFSARSLEVFVTVARTGSMSAAAEHLRLTQPAVSQAIGALETSLGVQLFDRSVRPPALTLQATTLLKHATAILLELQKFENALRLGHLAQLPALRIGMLNSVATTIGPQIMRRLRDSAAEVSVDTGFDATRFQALANREFDFIVTADEAMAPPDIRIMPFLTEPLLVVAPQSYPGDLSDVAALSAGFDLIRFGRDPNLINRIDRALQSSGVVPQRRYHFDTNEGVMQMVAAGAGWTILPVLAVVRSLMRSEPIRVARYPGQSLSRTVAVAMREGEGLHVAEQIRSAAVEMLMETIQPAIQRLLPEIAEQVKMHASEPLADMAGGGRQADDC